MVRRFTPVPCGSEPRPGRAPRTDRAEDSVATLANSGGISAPAHGGDNRVLANLGFVHHHCAHADHGVPPDPAAMQHRAVADVAGGADLTSRFGKAWTTQVSCTFEPAPSVCAEVAAQHGPAECPGRDHSALSGWTKSRGEARYESSQDQSLSAPSGRFPGARSSRRTPSDCVGAWRRARRLSGQRGTSPGSGAVLDRDLGYRMCGDRSLPDVLGARRGCRSIGVGHHIDAEFG